MRHQRHTLLVAALALAVIAVVPGGAVAADHVSVSGDQSADGTITVTVTEHNATVANASVTVEALNNSTYAGEGDHATGENGTVELPAPEQNVSVAVTATVNNTTGETTLDLEAPTEDDTDLSVGVTQADDGTGTVTVTNASGAGVANASVSVTALDNVTYAGAGEYTTDENGTVGLPAPEQNVTVDVVAEADNRTANATAALTTPTDDRDDEADTDQPFGQRVSAFVHQLQADGNMTGQQVAAFVVANNPGADNRPDHVDPGPPQDDDDEESEDGERSDGDEANGTNGNNDEANGNNGNGNGSGDGARNGNGPGNGNGGGNGNGNGGGNGNGNGGGNGGGPP